MEKGESITVLAVDDDRAFVELTAIYLGHGDNLINVVTVTDPAEALSLFADRDIDCIVSDFDMPKMDGLEFLGKIRIVDNDIPFILFTGCESEEVASDAISAGVTDYLHKGSRREQFTLLANMIRSSVAQYRVDR